METRPLLPKFAGIWPNLTKIAENLQKVSQPAGGFSGTWGNKFGGNPPNRGKITPNQQEVRSERLSEGRGPSTGL